MEATKISWTLGTTINTGNFQNIRIDCSVTDYKHEEESAKEASDRVYKFVENQLIGKLNEAREELS